MIVVWYLDMKNSYRRPTQSIRNSYQVAYSTNDNSSTNDMCNSQVNANSCSCKTSLSTDYRRPTEYSNFDQIMYSKDRVHPSHMASQYA